MSEVIWKFPIKDGNTETVIEMPGDDSTVLSVQYQGDQLCLWAKLNPNEEVRKRRIRVIESGIPIEDRADEFLFFIDTVQRGALVWHVFEVEDFAV
jgi:hypothetical protein